MASYGLGVDSRQSENGSGFRRESGQTISFPRSCLHCSCTLTEKRYRKEVGSCALLNARSSP
eukprot:2268311-Pleurochrysis_carterae.AAC.3